MTESRDLRVTAHQRKDLWQVERRLAREMRKRMVKMGASERWLVIESGVGRSTLHRFLRGERKVRLKMVDYLALCEVLRFNPAVLLREKVYD